MERTLGGPMPERPRELAKFKTELASLTARVLAVDIRAYESMPPDRLASELEPIVSGLLASANGLIAEVRVAYGAVASTEERAEGDPLAAPYAGFEQAIDAAIAAQSSSSLQAVGDIAFLAHLELRQRAERLERVKACRDAIAIVGECDSALRRVRKALTSIDLAFARAGYGEAAFDFASELEDSLRVRRACARLRARVLAAGEPTPGTLHAALRAAGTAIAMLVGWDVYPSLRVRDRLQLRDVQRRILDWLRHEKDPTAGMRLWQDLVAFVRMLAQVNRRQELLEHDAVIVHAAAVELESIAGAPPAAVLARLAPLEGLDEELDALLARPERAGAGAWHGAIARLARGYRRGAR
ncbi:MAG: hypothetical protein KIT84_16690 [Labilithrix sp.]|nr:hypothetical protein [Labilithrix sp.]MCW5812669.1 hypothetical protein [Labilithrix sp.]